MKVGEQDSRDNRELAGVTQPLHAPVEEKGFSVHEKKQPGIAPRRDDVARAVPDVRVPILKIRPKATISWS